MRRVILYCFDLLVQWFWQAVMCLQYVAQCAWQIFKDIAGRDGR